MLRRVLIALLLVGAIAAVALVASPGSRAEPVPLRIATIPNAISAGIHVADTAGCLLDEGISPRVDLHPSGRDAISALMRGDADVATTAETPLMHALLDGADLVVWATIAEGRDGIRVIARGDRGIRAAADLAGKQVGVPARSNATYFLLALLRFHGMSPASIASIDLPPESLERALSQGEVDAVAVWEPLATRIERSVPDAVSLAESGLYRWTWNLVGRRGDAVAAAAAVPLLRALLRANQRLLTADAALGRSVADWIGDARWSVDGSLGSYRYAVHLDPSLLYSLEDQGAALRGPQARAFDFGAALDPGPLRRVDPGAATAGLARAP